MILDLEKLSSDREQIHGDELVTYRDISGEESRVRCHVDLDVRRMGDTFYVHVDVNGDLTTACHRCLESARYRLTPSFDLIIQRVGPDSDPRTEEGEDEYIQLPLGQNQFSLDQHIYENVVVSVPMKIVCDDRCRGLCSGCGANLNREECQCAPETDPRWNGLRKLNDHFSK